MALVLSSGGARGLAHVGAIDALLANGYHITSVAGTSFGSIVAGMYASGHFEDFKAWMADIDRRRMRQLTDYKLSLNSIVKGERVINAMKEIAPDRDIETLDIPFCAVATDWKTGREVVFNKGSMWQAIRASISVPGYFAPLEIDDKILIVDDFLAHGSALTGLIEIVEQAGAKVVGCVAAIEKGFQMGGDSLRKKGYKVESLAIIEEMTDTEIYFREQ